MSGHTPGPWVVSRESGDTLIVSSQRPYVAEVYMGGFRSEWEANARLIAAAPELLEACKIAFDQTDQSTRPADWEMLRAAIAKATGAKT